MGAPSSLILACELVLGTLTNFFSALFLLRFFMQWRRISFRNQIGAFVMKLTDWAVKPLRRVIPGFRGLDWSCLLAVFFLQLVDTALYLLLFQIRPPVEFIALVALLKFLSAIVYLAMALILLEVVFSWINPQHPLAWTVRELTAPLLRPIRRLLPPIAGFDLSPLVALLGFQVLLLFLQRP
ncbi:MAG: YggT family protein [Zoogloeaceae bacterium]|jgi:YggT family protein|nr:YggT family protein [Zoogloeaceae bacterium]